MDIEDNLVSFDRSIEELGEVMQELCPIVNDQILGTLGNVVDVYEYLKEDINELMEQNTELMNKLDELR